MVHAVRLGALLYCLWFLLSGHLSPLLLALGLASVVVAVAIAVRMHLVDGEMYPVRLTAGVVGYWLWLGWQIVKANLQVARCILDPSLPISPCITRVRASQRTALGRVTLANGITLTPGTVSIDLDGDAIEIHALTADAARDVEAGEMDRRVSAMEGRS